MKAACLGLSFIGSQHYGLTAPLVTVVLCERRRSVAEGIGRGFKIATRELKTTSRIQCKNQFAN